MCGGQGQATTEQGTAPRTKERWNVQFLKLLLLPSHVLSQASGG